MTDSRELLTQNSTTHEWNATSTVSFISEVQEKDTNRPLLERAGGNLANAAYAIQEKINGPRPFASYTQEHMKDEEMHKQAAQDPDKPFLELEAEELNAVGEAIQEKFYEAKKELNDAPASTVSEVSQEKDADKPILEALFRISYPHLPMTEKDDEFSLRNTTLLSCYPRRLFLFLKSWYRYYFFAKMGQWEIVLAVLFILAAVSMNVGIGCSFGLSTSDNINYWQWGNTLIASNGISLIVCAYFELQWGFHLASVQWDLKQAEDLPRVRLIVARCWILFLNFCTGIVQAAASFKERAAIKEQLSAAREQLSTTQEQLSTAQEQAQDLSKNFDQYQRSVELCFFMHSCTDVSCSLDCLKQYTLSDPQ